MHWLSHSAVAGCKEHRLGPLRHDSVRSKAEPEGEIEVVEESIERGEDVKAAAMQILSEPAGTRWPN